MVQDLATQWIQAYPCKNKTSQETQRSLQKFLEPERKPKVIYTDNSLEFGKACEDLSWNHCTSTPHRSETNGIAERAVRRVKEDTSAVLLQSGLDEKCWADSMECYTYLRNVTDLEELETMDASEIYSQRLNAKRGDTSQRKRRLFFQSQMDESNLLEDQDLRTSTLIRERPIRGESNMDFLGEPEGSLPQPQDSLPDASEAINDFWSMSGSFIYRHHVEPRVKLYSPREESFPILLKYIDVTRTTHTNLDVKQEKRIDDYWNIDGSRDLSDPWTGFTQITLLEEKPPEGYMWSGERLTRKQLTSRPDH